MESSISVGWWYQLTPSIISILIVATQWWFDRGLKDMLLLFSRKPKAERDFAQRVALDWSARIGFHTALLSLFVSALVAAIDAGMTTGLFVGVVLALFVVAYLVQRVVWTPPLLDFQEGGLLLSKSHQLNAGLIIGNLATMAVIALIPDDRRAQVYELVSQLWPG